MAGSRPAPGHIRRLSTLNAHLLWHHSPLNDGILSLAELHPPKFRMGKAVGHDLNMTWTPTVCVGLSFRFVIREGRRKFLSQQWHHDGNPGVMGLERHRRQ